MWCCSLYPVGVGWQATGFGPRHVHAVSSSRRIGKRRPAGIFACLARVLFVTFMAIGLMGLHANAGVGAVHHDESAEAACSSSDGAGCQSEARAGATELCGPSVCAAIPAPELKVLMRLALTHALTFTVLETDALGAMTDRATPPPRRI